MKHCKYLLIHLFLGALCGLPAFGQFDSTYVPLRYSGKVPAVFRETSKQTLKRDLDKVQAEGELTEAESREYLITSNFAIRQTFMSGQVYFNEGLTQYLNRLATNITKHNPKYTGGLNLYTTKFAVPNAAAWRNGIIMFNIGLLAKLETESQAAFILAHEMAHIQEQHGLQKYSRAAKANRVKVKKDKKSRRGKAFGRGALDMERLFKEYRYSRKYELEADLLGFEYLKNTEYRSSDALAALILLKDIDRDQYVTLPADALYFPDLLREPGKDSIKKARLAKRKKPRRKRLNRRELRMLDSLRTHPSIDYRVKRLKRSLPEEDLGKSFLTQPTEFMYYRNIARFEVIRSHFENFNYHRALYESLQMLQEYPGNEYLELMTCRSAYWYSFLEEQYPGSQFLPDTTHLTGQQYAKFVGIFHDRSDNRISDWCLSLIKFYASKNASTPAFVLLEAQAEEAFGEVVNALVKYKEALPLLKETHGRYIKNKLNTL
ncbi:MAG: M48 family metallopeptidase [Bacteroidia bacterium]